MSRPSDPQQDQARMSTARRYISALEGGDLAAMAAIMSEAEHDSVLEALLIKVNRFYQAQDGIVVSNGELFQVRQFLSLIHEEEHVDNPINEERYKVDQKRRRPHMQKELSPLSSNPVFPERNVRQPNPFVRRLSLLAALLMVTLLVGSLALVFALSRGGPATGDPASASGWGKVAHVQTMPDFGFNGLAWSPDSQRVAASNRGTTTNVVTVRIWDAKTGKHLVNIPMNAHAFVTTIAWSPNSQQIAIETGQSVIIADGQTGHVIRTLLVPSRSTAFIAANVALFSYHIPSSGGPGLRSLAWSPDGNQIAASFFGSVTGSSVVVWNLQTGASLSLPVKSNQGLEGVSWSSDGKYIAADTFLQTSTDPLNGQGVTVWNVATRQMILQKNTGSVPDLNVVVSWQPGTQNLAQIGVIKVGNGYKTAILIFNGLTGKMLKTLVVPVSDVLTWSPDGKYLAYTSPADLDNGNQVQILDTSTWSKVYTYKNGKNIIDELAWAPNGHFIATGETIIKGDVSTGIVRVWSALD